jgi:hypothetical protein
MALKRPNPAEEKHPIGFVQGPQSQKELLDQIKFQLNNKKLLQQNPRTDFILFKLATAGTGWGIIFLLTHISSPPSTTVRIIR